MVSGASLGELFPRSPSIHDPSRYDVHRAAKEQCPQGLPQYRRPERDGSAPGDGGRG
jgi:hypothetical protein